MGQCQEALRLFNVLYSLSLALVGDDHGYFVRNGVSRERGEEYRRHFHDQLEAMGFTVLWRYCIKPNEERRHEEIRVIVTARLLYRSGVHSLPIDQASFHVVLSASQFFRLDSFPNIDQTPPYTDSEEAAILKAQPLFPRYTSAMYRAWSDIRHWRKIETEDASQGSNVEASLNALGFSIFNFFEIGKEMSLPGFKTPLYTLSVLVLNCTEEEPIANCEHTIDLSPEAFRLVTNQDNIHL